MIRGLIALYLKGYLKYLVILNQLTLVEPEGFYEDISTYAYRTLWQAVGTYKRHVKSYLNECEKYDEVMVFKWPEVDTGIGNGVAIKSHIGCYRKQ